jgi:hypothetical protein
MRYPKKKVKPVEPSAVASSEVEKVGETKTIEKDVKQGKQEKTLKEASIHQAEFQKQAYAKKRVAVAPTPEARSTLLAKVEPLTKTDVPSECLRVISEGPVTKAVNLFLAGELKLDEQCDYLSKVPDDRVVPRALSKAASFEPDASFPCAFSYYVDVALAHGPTVQAAFAHVLNAYRYNERAPPGVLHLTVVECISRLKKHNIRSKRKRKEDRRALRPPQGKYGAATGAGVPPKTEADEPVLELPESARKRQRTWTVATPNSSALM